MTQDAVSNDQLKRAIIEALGYADAINNTLISALLQHCLVMLDHRPSTG